MAKNNGLAIYMAQQISRKKLDYTEVVTKYPMYKEAIDKELSKLNIIPLEDE